MKIIKLNKNSKIAINLASFALAFLIVAGALVWKANYQPEPQLSTNTNRKISLAELSSANGKFNKECLVAVEGAVYKIEGSDLWKNGDHTPSENQAYCGADMTEILKKSPHGKSKLEQLEKVGTLEQ